MPNITFTNTVTGKITNVIGHNTTKSAGIKHNALQYLGRNRICEAMFLSLYTKITIQIPKIGVISKIESCKIDRNDMHNHSNNVWNTQKL